MARPGHTSGNFVYITRQVKLKVSRKWQKLFLYYLRKEAAVYWNSLVERYRCGLIDIKCLYNLRVEKEWSWTDKYGEHHVVYNFLHSHMQLPLRHRFKEAVKSLKVLERNGYNTGDLKFKRVLSSVPLTNQVFEFDDTFKHLIIRSPDRLNLISYRNGKRKVYRRFYVFGGEQLVQLKDIDPSAEIVEGLLLFKADGVYLNVVVRLNKTKWEYYLKQRQSEECLGIDLGIHNHIVFSTGFAIRAKNNHVNDRIKRLHKQLSRKQRGSKRYNKTRAQLQKAYLKQTYKRNELHNKIIAYCRLFKTVVTQKERYKTWQQLWGKDVQSIAPGRLFSKLEKGLLSLVILPSNIPTSKTCSNCGAIKDKLSLADREFVCLGCGIRLDRDFNAARNMLIYAKQRTTSSINTDQRLVYYTRTIPNVELTFVGNT